MLFDPLVLVSQSDKVLAIMAIVIVGTPIVAMALVLAFRYPLNSALVVGASLAQIGEFSFILVGLALPWASCPQRRKASSWRRRSSPSR